MVPQIPAPGNPRLPFHTVGIIIPRLSADDDRLIHFAGEKLAERFTMAAANYDASSETVLVFSFVPDELTELDKTILMGIGIQCAARREGVAVMIDDDLIVM